MSQSPIKGLIFDLVSADFTATGLGTVLNAISYIPEYFALQVAGVDAAPISWTVQLEGSLDGVNWTKLVEHKTTDGNGAIVWNPDTVRHVSHLRVNVTSLVLGSATAVKVTFLAY